MNAKRLKMQACCKCGVGVADLEPFDDGMYLKKVYRQNGNIIEPSWECRLCVEEGVVYDLKIEV